tara:strand:+ start:636 stop:977 length:342 start_codon:yes stop_codon:yes gene_type:complete
MTAKRLSDAWNKASQESGFHDPGVMTRVKAEKSRDRFYELFFQETGLHPAYVAGAFNDWNRLSHEEAKQIHAKHGGDNAFCAYLAEIIHRRFVAHTQNVIYTEDGPRSENESN